MLVQLARLVRHGALEQPPRLERLGFDLEPPALDPAEDQQVLDEPMEPLGFRADVFQQGGPRCVVVRPSGPRQDLAKPMIVVIGVRSS